jgi:membrane-bound lytic murein transglycosylase B
MRTVRFLASSALVQLVALTLQAIPLPSSAETADHKSPTSSHHIAAGNSGSKHTPASFRGWDYLVGRLRANNVSEKELIAVYTDSRMPPFSLVPFSVKPKEPAAIYDVFNQPKYHQLGASFLDRHKASFDQVETTLGVPREIVTAILVVESQIGKFTGTQMIVYRLSRLASANSPENLTLNYQAQKKLDATITFADVQRRGRYLEQTFLPEIPALIEIAKKNKLDILSMKGSSAGAFGIPQFLPSAFLRYGRDGNGDGVVSLHDEHDALWSTANYLASFGFRDHIPLQEKRSIIWRYNKSRSYIDAIMRVSGAIRSRN